MEEKNIEVNNESLYYVYKIKFRSSKLMAYGLFCFALNIEDKSYGFKQVLITYKPALFQDLMIELKWNVIKEKIFKINIEKREELNQALTEEVLEKVEEYLNNSNYVSTLIEYTEKDKIGMINQMIKDLLTDAMPGRIELQCEYEKTNIHSEEEEKQEKEDKKSASEIEVESEEITIEGSTENKKMIKIAPVIDPIWGVQINKLKKGKKVYTKIIDENFSEKQYSKLPSYAYGEMLPTFVEYYTPQDTETKKSGEKVAIFNFGEGYFGKINIYPLVKVKVFMTEDEIEREKMTFITDNTFLFYLILFGGAIALIILAWWYYNWLYPSYI